VIYYTVHLEQSSHELSNQIELEKDGEVSQIVWLDVETINNMELPFVEQIKNEIDIRHSNKSWLLSLFHSVNDSKIKNVKTIRMQESTFISKKYHSNGSIQTEDLAMNIAEGTEFAIAEWLRKESIVTQNDA